MAADEFEEWIAALRLRLDAGEFANLGPLDFLDGANGLPAELLVRIMLADVDHYAGMPPERRQSPDTDARRRVLYADLRRLRERLG